MGHCLALVKRPFISPPPRQRPPPLDFSGKKLYDDLLARPTTGDITPKKPIMVRLYPAPDLPTPMLAKEHRDL